MQAPASKNDRKLTGFQTVSDTTSFELLSALDIDQHLQSEIQERGDIFKAYFLRFSLSISNSTTWKHNFFYKV